jgi:hypothetical protein
MRPYNARNLGREVEVAYPFHPLFGRPAIVVADQLHNGSRHLTLRIDDEPSFLVPAWMLDPQAAAIKIVEVPHLSIARLLDLRAFLNSVQFGTCSFLVWPRAMRLHMGTFPNARLPQDRCYVLL